MRREESQEKELLRRFISSDCNARNAERRKSGKRVAPQVNIKSLKCKYYETTKVRKKSYFEDENNESEMQVMRSEESQ